jgi:hypothetical protein
VVDDSRVVRVLGDTAVVTAKLWLKGKRPNGELFDYKLWFSDTYVPDPVRLAIFLFGQAGAPLPKLAASHSGRSGCSPLVPLLLTENHDPHALPGWRMPITIQVVSMCCRRPSFQSAAKTPAIRMVKPTKYHSCHFMTYLLARPSGHQCTSKASTTT